MRRIIGARRSDENHKTPASGTRRDDLTESQNSKTGIYASYGRQQDRVDYDVISRTYNQRPESDYLSGIPMALRTLAQTVNVRCALDLGCGTGRSLKGISRGLSTAPICFGLDFSAGMLAKARQLDGNYRLVRATAHLPPFKPSAFDLIFSVHAFHHFQDQPQVVKSAFNLLRPGGAFAIVNIDPRECGRDDYIYKYFEGTYKTDLSRFPSAADIESMFVDVGFIDFRSPIVEQIRERWENEAIFDSYFLKKNACSQLILLTDEAYQRGMESIRRKIYEARLKNKTAVFRTELKNRMFHGFKPR